MPRRDAERGDRAGIEPAPSNNGQSVGRGPLVQGVSAALAVYDTHGCDLQVRAGSVEALGDCPFCGKEGKFSVHVHKGTWRCWRCQEGTAKGGGNWLTFLRCLWERSDEATEEGEIKGLAEARGYLSPTTLLTWGLRQSVGTGEWVLPGYSMDPGAVLKSRKSELRLNNLYRYAYSPESKKHSFYSSPGKDLDPPITHQLLGVHLYDPGKEEVWLCEGVWDAMALWEAARYCKWDERKVGERTIRNLVPCKPGEKGCLAGSVNVLAVPGANVFNPLWSVYFSGKRVTVFFDNDHPKINPRTRKEIPPAAIQGAKRVARTVSNSDMNARCPAPESISWLKWGSDGEGHDSKRPSGFDLRDAFKDLKTPLERVKMLSYLLGKVEPVPGEWVKPPASRGGPGEEDTPKGPVLLPLECKDWRSLRKSWQKAMAWTDGLERGLAFSLAVIVSTRAIGDQLWGRLISPPSTGKTTLAEAMSVSRNWVVARSTIRGFHTGFRLKKSGEDPSLAAECEGKTLIIKDADTLLKAPNRDQILSEMRDLYDTTARTSYRNTVSREYSNHRMTILLCGTSALRELDNSDLGERYLTCKMMDRIEDELEDEILLRVAYRSERNVNLEANGEVDSQDDPDMIEAKRLTGGYVEYVRTNAQYLISRVQASDSDKHLCARLGKFVAFMRARPSKKQDEDVEREFGARLVSQLMRLAKCLAAVLGKDRIDDEVRRQVRLVALDTAQGRTLNLVRVIYKHGKKEGLSLSAVCSYTHNGEESEAKLLDFLRRIGAVEKAALSSGPVKLLSRWKLSKTLTSLYENVVLKRVELEE